MTIRKREGIFITAPDEGLHFSFIPSIQPTQGPRAGKLEEIHLRTGEAHDRSDILGLCSSLQSSFYDFIDVYVGVYSKIFF